LRQAEVQSLFLKRFGELYPQLKFRGLSRFPSRTRGPYGFALRVAFGRAEIPLDLLCVILTDGHPQDVRRFLRRIKASETGEGAVPVLIAPYFSEEARALCREAGVGYFDLSGNAGLDTNQIFLDIQGRENAHPQKKELRSPFKGKAERVIRRLLLEPERRWKMRELSQVAEVSLGMASMVTSSLAKLGVVSKTRAGVELFDPAGLLEAWSQNYDLRESAYRIYRSWRSVPELEARLAELAPELGDRYALTLWSGARQLLQLDEGTPHLALYWKGKADALAKKLGWREDRGKSYIFVFQPYDESLLWGSQELPSHLWVVHPIQLYLDLGSGDEAELRLAQRVRATLLPW